MNSRNSLPTKIFPISLFLLISPSLFAQASGKPNVMVYVLVAIGAVLAIGVVIKGIGLIPGLGNLFGKTLPKHLRDKDVYLLSKGFDIKLEGEPGRIVNSAQHVTRYAVQPPNWIGMTPIPKVVVEVGESVDAGDPIFYDKKRPDIQYVAPVSGEIIEITRGAKRSIAQVVILADREIRYKKLSPPDIETCTREQIVEFLLGSGGWTMLRQRPFDIVPPVDSQPANVFISTFDTAPLAPNLNLAVAGHGDAFQAGLDVLGKLTAGTVHLGLDGRDGAESSGIFTGADGVEKHWFRGPHPCGNVGVQMHHIDPVSSERYVWVLGVQEVITLGRLWTNNRFDASRLVALTGAPLSNPSYVRTWIGANAGELLKGQLNESGLRIISGNVLSGEQKDAESYLNYYDQTVTVIEEGDYYELFGWLIPITLRPSVSRTFPNFLIPDVKYKANSNVHGERRAFVMTGEYENLLPMDIYPQHLMKAIMTRDFERMEGLGIHELSEEDIALCEFACTSKIPLQAILRDGLEVMRDQG